MAFLLSLILLLGACSKKKVNFFSKTYHRTTTHFNGYFNAREMVNESIVDLEKGAQENWEEPLSLFIYPTEESASSLYPTMDGAIEKCGKVIDRHSMLIKKVQYNTWIDDSYMLIGVSNFYKRNFPEAEEMFKYVSKQFKKEPIRHEANLWLAKINIERGNFTKAQTILEELEEKKNNFPKGLNEEFQTVYAHFFMKQQDWQNSVDYLQNAISATKKKKNQTRKTFILAQLYEKMGKSQKAIRRYQEVVKMNPDYEMKFYAQINQALAFDSRADPEPVREVMRKMLRDEKYIEFRDQIYYALAEVEFADRNVDDGIAHLVKSTEVSVNNPKQKGKSFHRLSEIYLEERQYESASSFYDSTMTYLPTDFPDYEVIKATQESLSELVFFIRIVDHEDSVQALAGLEDAELKKALNKIIKDKRSAEQERIRLEQEQRLTEFENRQALAEDQRNRGGNRGSGGKWYFYNDNSKSIGFAEFRTKFGERSLKDDWRRKNKQQIDLFALGGEEGEVDDSTSIGSDSVIPTLQELMDGLPLTEEAIQISNDTIAYALFEMGKIYKDKLEDYPNAIETFEDLNVRFPDNNYEQVTYYHLYRLFLRKEEDPGYFPSDSRSTSAYYKSLLTTEFPESEFAQIIQNPDYVAANQQAVKEEQEAYEAIYRQYRQRNFNEVLVACLDVMNNDPQNRLLAKYQLLRAMAIANKKDRTNFIKALQEIITKFPGTEESDEAKRLLGLLDEPEDVKPSFPENASKDEGKEDDTANTEDKEDNEEGDKNTLAPDNKPKGEYVLKEDTDHYFAILIPNKGNKISELKTKVSQFNQEFFRSDGFKTTNSFINSESQVILVRTLSDKETAMKYYTAFQNEKEILVGLNDKDFQAFVMSSKNFATMFKSKDIDGYMEFFIENYLN